MKSFVLDSLKEAERSQNYMTKIYVPVFSISADYKWEAKATEGDIISQGPENALCYFVGFGWGSQITKFIKIVLYKIRNGFWVRPK